MSHPHSHCDSQIVISVVAVHSTTVDNVNSRVCKTGLQAESAEEQRLLAPSAGGLVAIGALQGSSRTLAAAEQCQEAQDSLATCDFR